MLIGVSSTPWECDQKTLAQTYHKMILIPRPDYASMNLIWTETLFQYSGVSRQFDTGVLTRLSDGYTVGSIMKVINEVREGLSLYSFFLTAIVITLTGRKKITE